MEKYNVKLMYRSQEKKRHIGRCVVMHDAPSFLFITYINRFIFFKLR